MSDNPRRLYDNSFAAFVDEAELTVLGELCNHYHGDVRTSS